MPDACEGLTAQYSSILSFTLPGLEGPWKQAVHHPLVHQAALIPAQNPTCQQVPNSSRMLMGLMTLRVQVVHHPTVIAAYAEGRRWTFQGDVDLKSKFWGRSIELMPQGALLLDFHDGDQYVWHKVCFPGCT